MDIHDSFGIALPPPPLSHPQEVILFYFIFRRPLQPSQSFRLMLIQADRVCRCICSVYWLVLSAGLSGRWAKRIWDQYYLLFLLWRGNWIVERYGRLIQTFVAIVYLFHHGLAVFHDFIGWTAVGYSILCTSTVGTRFESSSFRIAV